MSERLVRISSPAEYFAKKREERHRATRKFVSFWASRKPGTAPMQESAKTMLQETRESKSWQEELAELRLLINESRDVYETQNSTSVQGFEKIMERFNMSVTRADRLTLPEAVMDTLAIFEDSYKKYSALSQSPVRNLPKGLQRYKRIGDALNPRDIRLVIKSHGLNGRIESPEELRRFEGFASLSSTNTGIASAHSNVIWSLKKFQLGTTN